MDALHRECEILLLAQTAGHSLEAVQKMLEVGVVEALNQVIFKQMICLFCLQASLNPTADDAKWLVALKENFFYLVQYQNQCKGKSLRLSANFSLMLYEELLAMRGEWFPIFGAEYDAVRAMQKVQSLPIIDLSLRNSIDEMGAAGKIISDISMVLALNWKLITQSMNVAILDGSFLSELQVFDIDGDAFEELRFSENFKKFAKPLLSELSTQLTSGYELDWCSVLAYVIHSVNAVYYPLLKSVEEMRIEPFVARDAAALRDRIVSGIGRRDAERRGGRSRAVPPPRLPTTVQVVPIGDVSRSRKVDTIRVVLPSGRSYTIAIPHKKVPVVEPRESWWCCF
jgi:hypothetical protein